MDTPPLGRARQVDAYARDLYRKVGRRLEPKRRTAIELRHLRSLMEHYDRALPGPEILLLGDSIMYWAVRETDRRTIVDMMRDILGRDVRILSLSWAGYNQQMEMAFLSGLARCRSRPRVVIATLSVQQLLTSFRCHPVRGQGKAVDAVQAAVAAWPNGPKSYGQPSDEEWAASDVLVVPSYVGLRRTMAELDLFINAASSSKSQRSTRLRHLLDSYLGESLPPDSSGLQLVTEVGTTLDALELPSVAYITPCDYELGERILGPGLKELLRRNAQLAEEAFVKGAGERGAVVNAMLESTHSEFADVLHLNQVGRLRLAHLIADAVKAQLTRTTGDASKADAPVPA